MSLRIFNGSAVKVSGYALNQLLGFGVWSRFPSTGCKIEK